VVLGGAEGPYYNTKAQVRDLERLVKQLAKQDSSPEPATGPRKRPRTAKQLNAAQAAQLIAGYQARAKLWELGQQFGIHPETAGLILRRNGIEKRRRGLSAEQEAEAERLYATGLSLKRVGELLGVDGETVRRLLISRGMRPRDQTGRGR
jgi:hypothetical protein